MRDGQQPPLLHQNQPTRERFRRRHVTSAGNHGGQPARGPEGPRAREQLPRRDRAAEHRPPVTPPNNTSSVVVRPDNVGTGLAQRGLHSPTKVYPCACRARRIRPHVRGPTPGRRRNSASVAPAKCSSRVYPACARIRRIDLLSLGTTTETAPARESASVTGFLQPWVGTTSGVPWRTRRPVCGGTRDCVLLLLQHITGHRDAHDEAVPCDRFHGRRDRRTLRSPPPRVPHEPAHHSSSSPVAALIVHLSRRCRGTCPATGSPASSGSPGGAGVHRRSGRCAP